MKKLIRLLNISQFPVWNFFNNALKRTDILTNQNGIVKTKFGA
jgi:hypothetical protein